MGANAVTADTLLDCQRAVATLARVRAELVLVMTERGVTAGKAEDLVDAVASALDVLQARALCGPAR